MFKRVKVIPHCTGIPQPLTCSKIFNLDIIVQGTRTPAPIGLQWASRQLTPYWNTFLLTHTVDTQILVTKFPLFTFH